MKQLGFYIDLTKCTGCKTCVVACKDAHNLEVGRNFRKVIEMQTGGWRQDRATGAWHQDVEAYYVPISCNHCADPACVKVCPTKAHHKRDTDGLVVIDTKRRLRSLRQGLSLRRARPQSGDAQDVEVRRLCGPTRSRPVADLRGILPAACDRIPTRTSRSLRSCFVRPRGWRHKSCWGAVGRFATLRTAKAAVRCAPRPFVRHEILRAAAAGHVDVTRSDLRANAIPRLPARARTDSLAMGQASSSGVVGWQNSR